MNENPPQISILTPVYNGEKYLAECIESVLAQTYQNWEYTIVNNCSTDNTLKIAQEYANKDKRIKVISNCKFVGAIENHNICFQTISEQSKYCKIVSADDWLFPECISRMVEIAEGNPSIGAVGTYSISPEGVRWIGLPLRSTYFPGREVCRLQLLGTDILGPPTATLYRAELVRGEKVFFSGSAPNADIDALFKLLQNYDYGFVHQILCFERVHEEAISEKLKKFNSFLLDRLEFLIKYGSIYLSKEEYSRRMQELLDRYYKYLAVGIVNIYKIKFWRYHENRMKALGKRINYIKLAKSTIGKVIDLLGNPKMTLEKIIMRLRK